MANRQRQLVLTELFSSTRSVSKKIASNVCTQQNQHNPLPIPSLENNSVLNSKASYENESEGCNTVAAAVAATVPPTLSTSHSYIDRLMASIKDSEWSKLVSSEFEKSYMKNICNTLEKQEKSGVTVFPPDHLIFNAFNLTPFDEIRVVLIGQDPYHDIGQAHGLCFSVPMGQRPPPSLKNIYKELSAEYPDFSIPSHGSLISWAKQGVFLLNATLTVEAHKANSHSNIGWQRFTDTVIRLISTRSKHSVVFLLWGGFAHKKEVLVNNNRHRVIKTAHPSPLSNHLFKGCKCFSSTNEKLKELGREPIDWTNLSG